MKKLLMVAFVALMALTLNACTMGTIETGNVGVVKRWGKVDTTEEASGFYFKFFASVDEWTAKEVAIDLNDMTPKAKDNLSLKDMDVTIYYETNPTKIAEFLTEKTGQSKWADHIGYPGYQLISGMARGATYDQVSKYDSLMLHTQRSTIEEGIKKGLQADLDADLKAAGTFKVTRVVIRSILTDPSIEAAIRENVQKDKELDTKTKEVAIARQEAQRMELLSRTGGGPNYIALLNAQAGMKIAEAIAAGKVNTIVVPSDFKGIVNVK